MKNSIRYKLFIGVSLFVLFIISLSWVLNTQFLEDYYLYKKKGIMVDNTYKLNKEYTGDVDNIADDLETIENNLNGYILIYSANGILQYRTLTSEDKGMGMGKNSPWNPILSEEGLLKVLNSNEAIFETQQHSRLKSDFLVMGYQLKNSDILLIQIPLSSIRENIEVANDFYLYIGIISLLVGMIIAFGFAKKVTSPIIKLNQVTKSLANLDFSKKSYINTQDEIGELAKNINNLSDNLDKTITELNNANEKLQEDIDRERRIDEMRKKFISDVSHELKTPISLIQGYAEGLKDSVMTDEESKEFYCDVIIDESGKMDKLVKDLLDLSQIQSGYFKLEKEKFDISILIKDILKKYQPIFNEKDIELTINNFNDNIIDADPIRIEQVFTNFMNNAINHLNNENILRVGIVDDKGKVRVSVFNTGNQIPNDEIENLWESFYKIDKARGRKYGGTGLGLAIVKGILDIHNGDYGINNLEDGVEFWFELKKN